MSKFGNKKITYDGQVFDSKKEFERWLLLKGYERSGYVKDLQRQVKYELIPAQYEAVTDGLKKPKKRCIEKGVNYKADFVYYDCRKNMTVVEDVKGLRTREYILKRKMMLYLKGIRITET